MSNQAMHETHWGRLFLGVWVGLLALTILEVFLAYQELSTSFMLITLMSLSMIKAGLIMAYFMHLRFERASLVVTLIPALVVCIALLTIFFPDSLRLVELGVRGSGR